MWQHLFPIKQHGNPVCFSSAFGDIRKVVSDQRDIVQVGYLLNYGSEAWLPHGWCTDALWVYGQFGLVCRSLLHMQCQKLMSIVTPVNSGVREVLFCVGRRKPLGSASNNHLPPLSPSPSSAENRCLSHRASQNKFRQDQNRWPMKL